MRFALHVALSHLRSRSGEKGVSAITAISILGVTIGVAALVVVLSVMGGFEVDLRDKILGSNAHLVVLRYGGAIDDPQEVLETLEAVPGIRAAAPFIYSEMMIRSHRGTAGVILKGADPERTGRVLDLLENIQRGPDGPVTTREQAQAVMNLLAGEVPPEDGADANGSLPGIIVGDELAQDLQVGVGDTVHIINPVGGSPGPFGAPVPDVMAARVVGIFYSGMYEYDTKWTYIGIPAAQRFLKMGHAVTGIEATVDDVDRVEEVAREVEARLRYPYYTRHWKNLNRNLFHALKLEKVVMGVILSLIVAVASLNIVGTLILLVLTKGREIAIMRAMGAGSGQIRLVFVLEGLIIGAVGAVVGTVLGLAGCWALKAYGWPLDTDVYYVDSLPVVVEPLTVSMVALVAVGICFLATLYPARRAAALDPVEGLRYE